MLLFFIVLVVAVHSGYACTNGWVHYPDSRVVYGRFIIPVFQDYTLEECKAACDPNDCRLIQYNQDTGKCKRFPYTYAEVDSLEYVSSSNFDPAANNIDLYECSTVNYCQCCLIGDPVLKPFHPPDIGKSFKIEDNGIFSFAKSTGLTTCDFTATVRTDRPEPFLHPRRSIVTHLLVSIEGENITLVHTPLRDEVASLFINTVPVVFPIQSPVQLSPLFVAEHNGKITVRHEPCDVTLTFADFKNSQTCLTVNADTYDGMLSGMCGQCNEALERNAFMATDYRDGEVQW